MNPVNPRIPNDNPVNPEIPKVRKFCNDGSIEQYQNGAELYQFEVVYAGSRTWQTISLATTDRYTDAFSYENAVWTRDDDTYFDRNDNDMAKPARIANFSAVCTRTATPLDIATQAAMDSSTAWQEVVNAGSYAAQAAAWNRWHSQHCVTGGSVNCGATYPTFAETCALHPGIRLSTGETCPV